jgi:hypothetical protein
MSEYVTLAAPVYADPGATTFRIALLVFDWEHSVIKVHLREWSGVTFVPGGKIVTATYEGAIARNLMVGLNKANLTTNTLHQRVLDRLLTDGKIPAGTCEGTPD